MASSFPGSIDNFTDPLSNSSLSSPSHAGQHSDLNDAVEKIETYMGLVKMVPTSAVGATVSATGTVTASGTASTISVNGCFTSQFSNYKIVLSWDALAAGGTYVTMRMRAAGTDTSGSSYSSYVSWTSTASAGVDRYTSSDSWRVVFAGTSGRSVLEQTIYAPQLTKNTLFFGTGLDNRSGGFVGATGSGTLDNTTSYDGFTLIAPGNVTGTIVVYGYRN